MCSFILPILQDRRYTWMNHKKTGHERVRNTCNLQWRTSQDRHMQQTIEDNSKKKDPTVDIYLSRFPKETYEQYAHSLIGDGES